MKAEAQVSKQKILVLEDESVIRETICDYFEQHGHEAIGAQLRERGSNLEFRTSRRRDSGLLAAGREHDGTFVALEGSGTVCSGHHPDGQWIY